MEKFKNEMKNYNNKSFLDKLLSREPSKPLPVYSINGISELVFHYCDETIAVRIVDFNQMSNVAVPESKDFIVFLRNGSKKAKLMELNKNGRASVTLIMENGQLTSF